MNAWRIVTDVLITAKIQRDHTRATAVEASFSIMMDIHALVCFSFNHCYKT